MHIGKINGMLSRSSVKSYKLGLIQIQRLKKMKCKRLNQRKNQGKN